jgi:effector-binding domain-containing protein
MTEEPSLTRRDRLLTLTKHVRVEMPTIGSHISEAYAEAYPYLESKGVAPAGPPFVIYTEQPSAQHPFAVDICAPVGGGVDPPQGWSIEELPASEFASLLHLGPYENLGASYAVLQDWIGAHHLVVTGPPREVYLSPPETPPQEIRTVVEFPVTVEST